MELFGLGGVKNISIEDFHISTPKVKVRDSLELSFKLLNESDNKANIRLEYAIYYQKVNNRRNGKMHKQVQTPLGEVTVSTPCDRTSSFDLQFIKK